MTFRATAVLLMGCLVAHVSSQQGLSYRPSDDTSVAAGRFFRQQLTPPVGAEIRGAHSSGFPDLPSWLSLLVVDDESNGDRAWLYGTAPLLDPAVPVKYDIDVIATSIAPPSVQSEGTFSLFLANQTASSTGVYTECDVLPTWR